MTTLLKRYNKRDIPVFKTEYRRIPDNPPFIIQLEEAPYSDSPITIPGFIKVNNKFPEPGKFYSDEIGFLYFNSADAGKSITINYFGVGSIVIDEDVNSLQNYVKKIEEIKIDKIEFPIENNILLCSDLGGLKVSSKKFNDNGTSQDDIWSANKIIEYVNSLSIVRKSYNNVYIGNGVQKIFPLSENYIENSERVYVNGIRQTKNVSYIVSGNAVVFEEPIPNGFEIIIDYDYL